MNKKSDSLNWVDWAAIIVMGPFMLLALGTNAVSLLKSFGEHPLAINNVAYFVYAYAPMMLLIGVVTSVPEAFIGIHITKALRNFSPPFASAYKAAYVGSVIGALARPLIQAACARVNIGDHGFDSGDLLGKQWLYALAAGFVIKSWSYGHWIKDSAGNPIGFETGWKIVAANCLLYAFLIGGMCYWISAYNSS